MRLAGLVALTALMFVCGTAAAQDAAPAYRDLNQSAEARAADLVGRMTLEEKARQFSDEAAALPRLGVPAYGWWNEGLHGVARADEATVFPQAIGMAATWNAPLMRQAADVIALEFRAKYAETRGEDGATARYRGLTVWSPNINIFRDPRWGRGQETYGEDPYLTSRIALAFIGGLQGDDLAHPITIATSKHFAVHSGPEISRHRDDIHPSAHDLEDTYLPAFRATVTEGHVQSVMCAYNAVDGVPACGNADLLTTRLREDWGFDGYVVSDCAAVRDIYREGDHHYVETPEQAVALAFQSGMDLICADYGAGPEGEPGPIVRAVQQGLLPEAVLDRSLTRLFTARFRLGLMDPISAGAYARITPADNDTPAHRALAQRMAEQSMVLLKNDGVLPLAAPPRTIAVIGPNADSLDALVGNYNGTPSHPVTVLDGLRARFPNANIVRVEGSGLIGPPEQTIPDAVLCADRDCRQPGLGASVFDGAEFAGAASATRTDVNARSAWSGASIRTTSTRWQGFIRANASGEHQFNFIGGLSRIWIGDTLVSDLSRPGEERRSAITLEAGHIYPLRVEAVQRGRRGDQRLVWTTPTLQADAAVAAAREADLIVFVGGLSPRIEGEEMPVNAPGFAGGDRTNLELPAPQEQLLEQLSATGKPLVFVLMSGSAVAVNWADQHANAIIEAWYPGGQGGAAVAGLIAGDFSPAGRLPVTFYKSSDDLPGFGDYTMAGRTYRYFEGEALYPFGYGLSYTSFAYSNVRVSRARIRANGEVVVSADITNTGARAGDEVAQLYLTHPGFAGAPLRALAGFERVSLAPGETKTVSFTLSGRALSVVNEAGVRSIPRGRVEAWIGGGQPVVRAGLPATAGGSTQFEVTSAAAVPR